ncbi:MAG: hypothetical protein ACOCVB_01805, partial [Bacillota bacterium]
MRTMDLFELYQQGILNELDVGRLLDADIEEIGDDNFEEIKENELLEEDKIDAIRDKLEVDDEEKLLDLAQDYLEKSQKEPKEILTDREGEFAGYRFQVSENIGSVTYHDVHVRLSNHEDKIYYGSLWYTDSRGNIRSFNYEVTGDGKINYSKCIGSRYYRQVRELTEKVLHW